MTPELTTAQLQAFKAAMQADPNVTPLIASGQVNLIVAYYNAASATKAWKTAVQPQQLDEMTPWTAFDTLDAQASGGKKLSWLQIFNYPRNFCKAEVRGWVTDVWGSATAGSNAEKILQGATESATRAEELFGGTVKTKGTVSALDRNVVGLITDSDVENAMRS